MTSNVLPKPTIEAPLVLAAFFDGKPTDGGGYVHKLGMLRVLKRMLSPQVDVVVICGSAGALDAAKACGLRAVRSPRGRWNRIAGEISGVPLVKVYLGRSVGRWLSPLERLLRRLKVDLAFFPSPDRRAMQLYTHSYIFTIMDLAHLEHPEFPEVSGLGEFERREQLFTATARKAVALIADSEPARRMIVERYGVPESRVFAAPFLASSTVREFKADPQTATAIRRRYGIKSPYIFYPAQFWGHKNHKYIVRALGEMRTRYGWAPQAVFCGSDKGMLGAILQMARDLGVDDLVTYCGFVAAEELPYLYQDTLALVMPTYFGPNNIPPLEAQSMGVPVCYSDFPGFREHFGNSVRYIDLDDPGTLADVLNAIRSEPPDRRTPYIGESRSRCEEDEEEYIRVLTQIVYRYRSKVFCPHWSRS